MLYSVIPVFGRNLSFGEKNRDLLSKNWDFFGPKNGNFWENPALFSKKNGAKNRNNRAYSRNHWLGCGFLHNSKRDTNRWNGGLPASHLGHKGYKGFHMGQPLSVYPGLEGAPPCLWGHPWLYGGGKTGFHMGREGYEWMGEAPIMTEK